ncbi:MAG: DUF4123 domain-containing protein [Pyrinomonadaceae bacterium]
MADNGASITERLFADDTRSVFVVLDGASVPGLVSKLQASNLECICLFRGALAPDVAEVAPYLVHLLVGSEFTKWITREGWGKHWGIFALSASDIRMLRQHFRTLLTVYDPNAKPVLFRYYDPRVMRTYLPTCNSEELTALFGPVDKYIMEDEAEPRGLLFRMSAAGLKQETFLIEQ